MFVVEADGSRIWSLPPNSPLGTFTHQGHFSPALSPDGSRVAYAAAVERSSSSDIVISALDGSNLRELTDHKAVDAYPVWSPDGTQILFYFYSDRAVSPGNPTLSLFVMDSDGSNIRKLSPESSKPIGKHPPAWSPDGTHIAFVVRGLEWEYLVYTIRIDGSRLTELGETASSPAWSPDGSRVAFVEEGVETRRLTTVKPDGSDLREVWPFRKDDQYWYGDRYWYDNVSWSPDGSSILIGVSNHLNPLPVTVVEIEPRSGRATEPLVVGHGGASWSPDGSRIAFHQYDDSDDVIIYTTASDGSDERVLVRGDYEQLVAAASN